MKIRDYKESDYNKLRSLINAFHKETEENPESLEDFYNKNNLKKDYIALVAEERNSIVGFIIGRIVGVLLKRVLNGINTDKNIKRVIGIKLSIDKISPSILVGGVCGFFIIMILAISFPAIGATATSLIFIIGMLSASLFYDHIGALNLVQKTISVERVAGVLLVITGTFLALRSTN